MRFKASELGWPLPDGLDDSALEDKLYPLPPPDGNERPLPDWEHIARELNKKHVTLALLWEEYYKDYADRDPYQYTWFCKEFRVWSKRMSVTMVQAHKAGEKMFVDWAGSTVPIVDPKTGEVSEAQIFVATLGLSSYTYVEAFENQKTQSWIAGHIKACEYFGGVPEIVVPDNPKTGVTKAHFCEPDINPTYQAWAEHSRTAIIPARPRRPKDKAKVETSVKVSGMWILARLRNRTFYSLEELNAAIWELLEELNDREFQKRSGSRRSWYSEHDKPALRPLPFGRFEIFEFKKSRVAPDYHIQIDEHYYSVPFTLVRELVEVCVRPRIVQFFHRNRMIACHHRKSGYGYTTSPEHMPPHHRHQAEWTPERFESWALHSGQAVREFVTELIKRRNHPQQAFRSCFGLLRLASQFGGERLNAACLRASTLGAFHYKSVQSILEKGLDNRPLPDESTPPPSAGYHENVRGAAYYSHLELFSDN